MVEIIIVAIGGILVGAFTLAALFWKRILRFAESHVLPWIEKHLPELTGPAREALVFLDKAMVGLR